MCIYVCRCIQVWYLYAADTWGVPVANACILSAVHCLEDTGVRCVCVCIYVYTYVYVYVYYIYNHQVLGAYPQKWLHAPRRLSSSGWCVICLHVWVHVCIYVSVYTFLFLPYAWGVLSAYIHTHTPLRLLERHIYIYTCVYICIYISICVHICTYI